MDYRPNAPYEEFSLYAIDRNNGRTVAAENEDAAVEAASVIKSPIGALALLRAQEEGHDPNYSFSISRDDVTRRATTRFSDPEGISTDMDEAGDGWTVTLDTLLRMNIASSCATSANVLIEYVGGRDKVNASLGALGLRSTRLISEKIELDGPLSTPDVTPRIGETTARDLAGYFHSLEHTMTGKIDRQVAEAYVSLHHQTERARLLSRQKEQIPDHISFWHKTGSIFNHEVGQAIIVDAGVISNMNNGQELAIAAHLTTVRDSLRGVNSEFSQRALTGVGGHFSLNEQPQHSHDV